MNKALQRSVKSSSKKSYQPQLVLDFMPAAIEILERPASPIGRLLGRSIIALCIFALIWSHWGELDVVSIAQGKIIPNDRVKQVQPLVKGTVKNIFIRDGELVEAGQALIELEQDFTIAEQSKLEKELAFAKLNLYRQLMINQKLAKENNFTPASSVLNIVDDLTSEELAYQNAWIEQHWLDYQAQIKMISQQVHTQDSQIEMNQADIDKYKAILPIIIKRAETFKSLNKSSYVSESSYLELEQQRIEYQQNMKMAQAQSVLLSSIKKEKQQQINQLKAKLIKSNLLEIENFRRQVYSLEQELDKARVLNEKQLIRSPVKGYVQQLSVNTIGGIVTDAQPLMLIVPESTYLEAEVELLNRDIGFVNIGQIAQVKIATFDFTLYGMIEAEIIDITADAVEDEQGGLMYKMRLKLKDNRLFVDGKWVDLVSGMIVTAEVKTTKRRVIDYFLSPIQKTIGDSLGER